METKFYLLGEVAEMLECPRHRIVYQLITKRVPEPTMIGGRRCFTREDVAELREALGRTMTKGEKNDV